jgi:hypothetical protein
MLFISEIERRERETTFLENAKAKHDTKFDYSKVYYTNNVEKVTIICRLHGKFTQSPAKHLSNKYACPECAKIAQGLSQRIDKTTFIGRARMLYGNIYNYDNTVVGRKKETIEVYCIIHKQHFTQMLGSHLKGHTGCKECLREKKEVQAHETFKKDFIRQFIEKFGDKYDFSKVVYINNKTPVLVKCKKHNCEFLQVHRNIKRSATCSCPECKKEHRLLHK